MDNPYFQLIKRYLERLGVHGVYVDDDTLLTIDDVVNPSGFLPLLFSVAQKIFDSSMFGLSYVWPFNIEPDESAIFGCKVVPFHAPQSADSATIYVVIMNSLDELFNEDPNDSRYLQLPANWLRNLTEDSE